MPLAPRRESYSCHSSLFPLQPWFYPHYISKAYTISPRYEFYSFTTILMLQNTLYNVSILPMYINFLKNSVMTSETACTRSDMVLRRLFFFKAYP